MKHMKLENLKESVMEEDNDDTYRDIKIGGDKSRYKDSKLGMNDLT